MGTGQNSFDKLVAFLFRSVIRINGGLEVIGIENVPQQGGVLVAANHISYLDPPAIGSVIPRKPTFMARKGLFEIPVLKWFISHFAFPVDRERPRPSTIKDAVKRLRNGELVLMFPEGRRNDTGELSTAKRGIGLVASLGNVPVIPTIIIGSDRALPPNARWLKRAKISIVFGTPLDFTAMKAENKNDGHALHEEISNAIMSEILGLQQRFAHLDR
jgi:1-acyl-sn-glycerol-3-phosphate acyltransferase